MIKRISARRLRWLISHLPAGRGDRLSGAAIKLGPTNCFGALGEREQLALQGFVDGPGSPQGKRAA